MKKICIDSTAHVSEAAQIGEGTTIWINSQVRERANIGSNCNIGKDTYIDADVTIGNNVKIQNGVSLYRGVIVESDVFIGPYATFTNDFYPRSFSNDFIVEKTTVKTGASVGANATIVCGNTLGEYCMIGAGSVVTHDVEPYALVVGNPGKQIGWVCKCGKKLVNKNIICSFCGYKISDNYI
jgi:UDP-2-acetamido-3-amino-2,3-dideoxy-glucuronate N-acetyltransferase